MTTPTKFFAFPPRDFYFIDDLLRMSLSVAKRSEANWHDRMGLGHDTWNTFGFLTEVKSIVYKGPRQSGHTTAIVNMLRDFKQATVFTYNFQLKQRMAELIRGQYPTEMFAPEGNGWSILVNANRTKRYYVDCPSEKLSWLNGTEFLPEAIFVDIWSIYTDSCQREFMVKVGDTLSGLPRQVWPYIFLVG